MLSRNLTKYSTLRDDIEKRITVKSSKSRNSDVGKDFEYLAKLVHSNDDKLSSNYSLDDIFKDETKLITVAYFNKHPYHASTAIYRDMFKNGCRIGNRYIVNPQLRIKDLIGFDLRAMCLILKDQVKILENDFDYFFVSREQTPKTLYYLQEWLEYYEGSKWNFDISKKYLVNYKNKDSNWQYVVWKGQALPLSYETANPGTT